MTDIETVRKWRKVIAKVYEDAGCEYTATEEEMLAKINEWENHIQPKLTEDKHDSIS